MIDTHVIKVFFVADAIQLCLIFFFAVLLDIERKLLKITPIHLFNSNTLLVMQKCLIILILLPLQLLLNIDHVLLNHFPLELSPESGDNCLLNHIMLRLRQLASRHAPQLPPQISIFLLFVILNAVFSAIRSKSSSILQAQIIRPLHSVSVSTRQINFF